MATKKHKKRRHDTRTEEQKAQSERDIALAAEQKPAEKKKGLFSRSKDNSAKAKSNKKPNIFKRFINWCKEVKTEMQRVVWPTRPELINASLIVVGALVFFGVFIAIIDNIVIIPLNGISSLGVNIHG